MGLWSRIFILLTSSWYSIFSYLEAEHLFLYCSGEIYLYRKLTRHWFIFFTAENEDIFSSPSCGLLIGIYILYENWSTETFRKDLMLFLTLSVRWSTNSCTWSLHLLNSLSPQLLIRGVSSSHSRSAGYNSSIFLGGLGITFFSSSLSCSLAS